MTQPAITYRFMTEADLEAVGALAHRIWHAHYPSIITVAQIDYMLAKSYTPESLARQLREGQRFLLAFAGNSLLGFLSVGALEKITDPILRGEKVQLGDYFLHKFYIAPEAQGSGLGTSLLDAMLRQMPEIRRLRLQVARANVNSWNFYLKRGFTIEAEADFPIGDGYVMKDYVMEKRIA